MISRFALFYYTDILQLVVDCFRVNAYYFRMMFNDEALWFAFKLLCYMHSHGIMVIVT